jgi:hypothetical protein
MRLWPDEAVMPRRTAPDASPYVRSYLIMRTLVGLLGIAVPVLLVFGEPILFDDRPFPLGSLSAYYYSGAREVFVGSLFAIGGFLITYKIADHSWENIVSIVAGLAVVTVALFPTGRPGAGVPLTPLQAGLGESAVERVHYGAGAIFFTSLALISYLFSRAGPQTGRRSPAFWRRFHLACCGLILAALALALAHLVLDWPGKGLLIAETVAVWAFGLSWLMKGFEIVEEALGMRRVTPPA